MSLLRSLHAEALKALSLKPLRRAAALTIGCTALISYAVAATSEGAPAAERVWALPTALQWGQVGCVAVGAMVAGSEYVGGQSRTTCLADPRRLRMVLAKVVTTVWLGAVVAALTLAASVGAAWVAAERAGVLVSGAALEAGVTPGRLGEAAAYQVLVALLGLAAAGLARSFVVGAGAVSAVLLVSPLAKTLGDWATWLPPGDGVARSGVELAVWPIVAVVAWAWAARARDA